MIFDKLLSLLFFTLGDDSHLKRRRRGRRRGKAVVQIHGYIVFAQKIAFKIFATVFDNNSIFALLRQLS